MADKRIIARLKKGEEGRLGKLKITSDKDIVVDNGPLTVLCGPLDGSHFIFNRLNWLVDDGAYLATHHAATDDGRTPDSRVKGILTRLFSSRKATIERIFAGKATYSFSNDNSGLDVTPPKKVKPLKSMRKSLANVLNGIRSDIPKKIPPKTVFLPIERSLFSMFINRGVLHEAIMGEMTPVPLKDMSMQLLRYTYEYGMEDNAKVSEDGQRLLESMHETLGGHIAIKKSKYGEMHTWMWVPVDADEKYNIELTTPAQKAAWPIYHLMIGVLSHPPKNKQEGFTFYIEEPEMNLPPAAQVALTKSLLYMIEKGYRITITTNSPIILETINEAMEAYKRGDKTDTAISPEDVSAYYIDESVTPMIDRNSGEINVNMIMSSSKSDSEANDVESNYGSGVNCVSTE